MRNKTTVGILNFGPYKLYFNLLSISVYSEEAGKSTFLSEPQNGLRSLGVLLNNKSREKASPDKDL